MQGTICTIYYPSATPLTLVYANLSIKILLYFLPKEGLWANRDMREITQHYSQTFISNLKIICIAFILQKKKK